MVKVTQEQLDADIQEFLKRGGKITRVEEESVESIEDKAAYRRLRGRNAMGFKVKGFRGGFTRRSK